MCELYKIAQVWIILWNSERESGFSQIDYFWMGFFNFGSSSSSSNVAELGFCGTIGENPDFDAEDSAKALHKAFHSKYSM